MNLTLHMHVKVWTLVSMMCILSPGDKKNWRVITFITRAWTCNPLSSLLCLCSLSLGVVDLVARVKLNVHQSSFFTPVKRELLFIFYVLPCRTLLWNVQLLILAAKGESGRLLLLLLSASIVGCVCLCAAWSPVHSTTLSSSSQFNLSSVSNEFVVWA